MFVFGCVCMECVCIGVCQCQCVTVYVSECQCVTGECQFKYVNGVVNVSDRG